MSDAQARLVIANALFMGRGKNSSFVIPWCTYTDPEIAHIGMAAKEAEEKGIKTTTFTQELREVDRAILDGEAEGFIKVLVKQGTDQILGVTIVADHAGDMIGALSIAMAGKVGLKTIASAIFPYPTQAECIKRVADQYNATRLTPFIAKILSTWLRWKQ